MERHEMMRQAVIVAAVAAFLTASSTFAGPVEYYYTDLGPGKARAINSNGEVVGSIGLWRDGQVIELGFDAYDISDTDIIVGVDGGNSQPCMWQEGVKTYLPLSEGATDGYAYGVNDAGDVVGQVQGRPAFWHEGELTILPHETWGGTAYDINNNGVIVGGIGTIYADQHAHKWVDGVAVDLDPEHWMGEHHSALALNDAGTIVGRDDESRIAHDWTQTLSLPGTEASALGLNEFNDVVGVSNGLAVLWQDGVRHELQDLLETWQEMGTYSVAEDINDSGQIVGWYNDGSDHAFMLTPVPEPATVGLLMAGAWAMLRRRRMP